MMITYTPDIVQMAGRFNNRPPFPIDALGPVVGFEHLQITGIPYEQIGLWLQTLS
jgi:hypothetical protein